MSNAGKFRIIVSDPYPLPMTFLIYEEHGVKFAEPYTKTDLTIAKAVLLDLADALELKLSSMVN